jgi:hypothetical protein
MHDEGNGAHVNAAEEDVGPRHESEAYELHSAGVAHELSSLFRRGLRCNVRSRHAQRCCVH